MPSPAYRSGRRQDGAMLAELVVAMAVLSLLAGAMAAALTTAFRAHVETRARSARALDADHALRLIAREVRRAVPGSVRVPDAQTVELLHLVAAGRYRRGDGSGPDGIAHSGVGLVPGVPLTAFNLLGRYLHLAPDAAGRLPVGYQVAVVASDAVNGGDSASVSAADNGIRLVDAGDEDQLRFDRPHSFPVDSPGYRVYVADGWRRYQCPAGAGSLLREAAPVLEVPVDPTTMSVVLGDVSRCTFALADDADGQRVLGLRIEFDGNDGAAAQQVLMQSLAVNVP
ncbi:hypothetical protein [Sinimarinibacterium flocculans]